ncbi:nucleotidyl transferase AbiEii/AbiGii toxin family protein [Bernardetia sp.]|uniref:nucleotidyl transferase AbiEii/AbiGii toxin family protein n=1 Tax=Bernardetia sp. TaxID=1937974 RepID=UPI0025C36415|nr:nucleotidyl transferase AbiEii/AbiGii toxin family protein [Bernardetia sp.]
MQNNKLYILELLLETTFNIQSAESFVVFRGSLLTKSWIQPKYFRSVSDLDFLAISDYDKDAYTGFVKTVLKKTQELYQEIKIDLGSLKVEDTWTETENPSFRFYFDVKLNYELFEAIQIDIAFGDTLVLPSHWTKYECFSSEKNIDVFAVQTEQALAWKVHGLFEFYDKGGRWQVKDLYDVFCILKTRKIDKIKFEKCIPIAFQDKKTPIALSYQKMKNGTFGKSKGSQKKWKKFLLEKLNYQNIPQELELDNVISRVKIFLDPVLTNN